jgi:hypothetical protein
MWIVGMGAEPEIDTLKRISHGSQGCMNLFNEWCKINLFREAVFRLKRLWNFFPVHRMILLAYSAYFRTLLTTLYFKNIDVLLP